MRNYDVAICENLVQLMRDKGLSISKLSELSDVSETTIGNIRHKRRVQKTAIEAVVKALASLPDNKKKDLWDDKLSCVVRYIPQTMAEPLDPDHIGNYHGSGRSKFAMPDKRSEEEIERRWAYG